MYETIVVGTDGSDRARIAVDRAAQLLDDGGTVHVLHAFHSMAATTAMGGGVGMVVLPDMRETETEVAQAVVTQACSGLVREGTTVELHLSSQPAAAALLDLAESVGADAIVVGNRGMAGARRFLGSVPSKVSHHACCDVVIVHT